MATENAGKPIILRPGESRCQVPFAVLGDLASVLLSSRDTQGRLAVCELVVEPNRGRQAQTHRYEDMWFYVVEGQVQFEVAGLRSVMAAGASIYIPRNTSFRLDSVGSTPLRLLVVATPGGLDLFYAEMGRVGTGDYRPGNAVVEDCLVKHGVLLAKESE